jgi:hypothetical protein
MTHGRYRRYFWSGLTLSAITGLVARIAADVVFIVEPLPQLPEILGIASVPLVHGLLLHEHAYVQAGQSVPLA